MYSSIKQLEIDFKIHFNSSMKKYLMNKNDSNARWVRYILLTPIKDCKDKLKTSMKA